MHVKEAHREILFVKETNDHIAVWEGAKLSKSQATASSGVQTVYWLKEFDSIFPTLMAGGKTYFILTIMTTTAKR